MNDCTGAPGRYAPDTVWSYEIGTKAALLDGRAQLDASAFHIRWSNELTPLESCEQELGPGGTAASNGFDIALRALLTERVTAGLGIAYTDAHYTRTAKLGDVVIVQKGDAIAEPYQATSPWSLTGSIEYHLTFASDVTVSVRAEDVFHSHNPGPFYSDEPTSPYYATGVQADPSTNVLNLRADCKWSGLDMAFFLNNALNSQPTLMRQDLWGGTLITAATFRPRTIGLTANWRF